MTYNAWHKQSYKEFVDKFKAKHTTDDCITPVAIYDAVARWACNKYHIKPENVVRPFWPGQDYKKYDYKPDDVVVDNPPFSLNTKIIDYYQSKGIKFFLFAPGMTMFSALYNRDGLCGIVINPGIHYQNGANVSTCFITNLDPKHIVITAPDLSDEIKQIQDKQKGNGKKKRKLLRYKYPSEVLMVNELKKLVRGDVSFAVDRNKATNIHGLDSQKPYHKQIFGYGLLTSVDVAKAKDAALLQAQRNADRKAKAKANNYDIVWTLSDRERKIVDNLGK